MRKTQPARLFGAVSLAVMAAALAVPTSANAQSREAHMCATQTESLAEQRIAACSGMLKSGRLNGKPAGVAYALRGLAYLDRGDIAHAIADLNQAIERAPDFAPAYQNRGNAWYARGNYGQALADYDDAIRLDPNSPSPYVNRATLRRDLGNADGALKDYQKAISLGADSARLFGGRGQLYLRQRDYAAAIADFDHAVRLDPRVSNYMLRAQAHEASGALDRALSDYAEAARLDPKDIGTLTAQAAVWAKTGNLDKAIAVYDRAVAIDQNRAITYALRAQAYAQKGDRKHAMADISRALKFSWTVNFLQTRGTIRLDDGDLDGVVHDADAMLKLEPDNAPALALREAALARKKNDADALADLAKERDKSAQDKTVQDKAARDSIDAPAIKQAAKPGKADDKKVASVAKSEENVDRPDKKREKQERSRNEKQKVVRPGDSRKKFVADDKPRYVRAGSEESFRAGGIRFTDIWTERR